MKGQPVNSPDERLPHSLGDDELAAMIREAMQLAPDQATQARLERRAVEAVPRTIHEHNLGPKSPGKVV
ncbi:MAG: hypothetical protein IT438_10835 [Phycisphaerales bacterium]|nr:hypothetical protein [Phycisphaerales bacterium]